MPELPEVEHLRRSLAKHLLGAIIGPVRLRRADVLDRTAMKRADSVSHALLAGRSIKRIDRHGKQLAIIADNGQALVVHLGMSGQLAVESDEPGSRTLPPSHRHAEWRIESPDRLSRRLVFRDPRRFGGLWALPSEALLRERWRDLGVDATALTANDLQLLVRQSRRAVKAVLLDQSVIAGIGNIYADESLFRAAVRPSRPARALRARECTALARSIVTVLNAAIASGGSTIGSYVDAEARRGSFQERHAVYGRAGAPCIRCQSSLRSATVAGRTTVWCPRCQR